MPEISCTAPDKCRPTWVLALATGLLLFALLAPASAHFLLNLNVRVFHIQHVSDGLIAHIRTPMPYLVADKLGEVEGDTLPEPAPFTTNARENGQIVHYFDPGQFASDPLGLGVIAEDGLNIESGGQRLRGTVEAVVRHAVGTEPGFATLAEARAVFDASPTTQNTQQPLYVGDTVIDLKIRYIADGPVASYVLSSQLDPGLPDQENTANLILDYGPGEPKIFRSRGLLTEPIEITRSRMAAIRTFAWEGVRHILEGLDHVLFVVCLVLGATALHSLLWRVTGFTIGHSATLALGFFGVVPSGPWFIPAVESGIALSIIYAAIVALRRRLDTKGTEIWILLVTMVIGLLHGLGFSFVLKEILQVTSPNIWQSLLAFNVGVELGQLLIVLAIWPALRLLGRVDRNLSVITRAAIALGCMAIAMFWSVDRLSQFGEAIAQITL